MPLLQFLAPLDPFDGLRVVLSLSKDDKLEVNLSTRPMSASTFVPKDGQVDYTNIRYAPVINVVVTHRGKVLLVQRSSDVRLYPDYWATINGFLDNGKSIEEKAKEELEEEVNIKKNDIISLKRGQPVVREAPEYNKTWLVMPVHAEISTDKFRLNEEAQTAGWFKPSEIKDLKLMPKNELVIKQFLK